MRLYAGCCGREEIHIQNLVPVSMLLTMNVEQMKIYPLGMYLMIKHTMIKDAQKQ